MSKTDEQNAILAQMGEIVVAQHRQAKRLLERVKELGATVEDKAAKAALTAIQDRAEALSAEIAGAAAAFRGECRRVEGELAPGLSKIERVCASANEVVGRVDAARSRFEAEFCVLRDALQADRKAFAAEPRLVFVGKYESGRTYKRMEVVEFNGSSYVSLADGNNETPGRGSVLWQLLARRGAGGAPSTDALLDKAARFYPTIHWFGSLIDETAFGYFYAEQATTILGTQIMAGVAPVGANATFDIIDSGDTEQGLVSTLTAGSKFERTAFSTPLNLAQGDYIRLKVKSIGSTTAGSQLTINLVCRANG